MVRPRFLLFTGLVAVALVALAACGGGGDGGSDDGDGDDEIGALRTILATQDVRSDDPEHLRYFSDVQQALDLFGSKSAAAQQESREAGDARSAWFASFRNAGAGVAFVPVLERLREITPPDGYVADHARLIVMHEELTVLDRAFRQAVDDEDFAATVLANASLQQVGTTAQAALTPNLCNTISRGGGFVCTPSDIPGGDYGAAFNAAYVPVLAAVTAAGHAIQGGYPPVGTPEEESRIVATLFTAAVEAREAFLALAGSLEPPPPFADAHARFLAAVAEAHDLERDLARRAAAGEIGLLEMDGADVVALRAPFCRVWPGLSEEFRLITNIDTPPGDPDLTEFCSLGDA